MIIKLAALGALGYAGYRYLEKQGYLSRSEARFAPDVRLAGGPLSDQASVQHNADAPTGQVNAS